MAKKAIKYFETDDVKLDSEKLRQRVLQDFKNDESARSNWEAEKLKNYDRYEGILPPKDYPWIGCSNVHVPLGRIVVDTYHANLSRSFSTSKDLIRGIPVANDDQVLAEKRPRLINYQLRNELDIDALKDKIFHISLTYGDSITKQVYEHRERKKTQKEIDAEIAEIIVDGGEEVNDKINAVEQSVVLYDGTKSYAINIEDLYKPADGVGLQAFGTPGYPDEDCEHIIYKTRITRAEYLKRVVQEGYPKIDFAETPTDKDDKPIGIDADEHKKNDLGISATLKDTNNYVTILEWYGEYYNEKDNTVTEMVIIIHPQTGKVLKAFLNPWGFRPFNQYTPVPTPNQPYGKSLLEILKDLQAEMNTIHNQRRDSETKRIAQPGFYDKGSNFSPKKYLMEPMGMYPTDGPPQSSVYFPPFQDAPASAFQEEEIIWKYVEQLMAIGKPVQGIVSPGDTTATEISSVVQHADIRFDLVFKRYERAFKKLVQQIIGLNVVHMPEEKQYRILGSDGRFKYESIKRSEFGDKLDIIFEGNSVANEIQEKQQRTQVYSILMQNPLVAGDPASVYNVTKWWLEGLDTQNIDKLLPMPPQAAVRTPQEENEMMYRGIVVPVQLGEDPEKHLLVHDNEANQIDWMKKTPQNISQIFLWHLEQTKAIAVAQRKMKEQGAFQGVGASPIQANNTVAAPQVGGGGLKKVQ